MKFTQIIEYNMSKILFDLINYTQNAVKKTIPILFPKESELSILWMNSVKFYAIFLYYAKLRFIEIY